MTSAVALLIAACLSALWCRGVARWARARGVGHALTLVLALFALAQLALLPTLFSLPTSGENHPGWLIVLAIAAGAWCFILTPAGLIALAAARRRESR